MRYNDLSAYKEIDIRTAGQGTLILMLYDEGIKQISFAITLMDCPKIHATDIEKINNHILKAQEIITELSASLNLEEGGEIAANLLSIYTYFNQQLLQANIQKKIQPLITVKEMMNELRGAWEQIVNTSVAAPAADTKVSSGINIAG
ncbi:flagellar export chaperone FliS [Treponema phagedenis]|uniref:Flagellar secretion chaperone FliS n=1 Tax=Treponema phagedenis TaxID=162 RepID=A0A0B7GW61_TREPH|nr:flagellar export chaperone FliS [Treponema phagedenis]EFW38695.1 flagellar protein FliS [Treponema phagedenis F0421]NVP22849.1 flagellar export chaperone FliS [Treponema phagedenis]QEJ94921.1 flagellar export chaperone FliS [Treponema phagedenis]QEJ98345.1 flagellar export chaperone FliS [Treponema phagedenis]QEK00828.1 flagellar export chaperone FliS [Treponema phagedenis]